MGVVVVLDEHARGRLLPGSQATRQPDQRLIAQLVHAQEAERQRIAADIHDDSLQAMASAVLRLGILSRELPEESQRDDVERVTLAVEAAIGRLRRLIFELNPPRLSTSSLSEILREYMVEFAADARVEWQLTDTLVNQPPDELKTILFRVAQEALRNIRKHADARRIEIVLAEREGWILLQIRDDGIGFSPDEAWRPRPGHVGMPSMRDRLERAGGRLEMRSAPGAGAVVEAWLPDHRAFAPARASEW